MRKAFAALLIGAWASSATAEAPADFAYRVPLTTDGDAAFVRVELPAQVYEGAVRRDLGDLRVFNGEGTAVAFAFLPRPAAARESTAAFDMPYFPLRAEAARTDVGDLAITVRRTQGGTSVDLATHDGKNVAPERLIGYLVDASDAKQPLAALTLALPGGANVTTRVRIDAGDDLTNWRTIVANAPLLALESNGRRLTRERVEMPPTMAKFLRVTFVTPNPAVEVASIRADVGDRTVEAPRQWREATGAAVRDAPATYEFDLRGTFPVDRVTLVWSEQNTVAPTELFVRASPKDEWRLVASTVFYRLRQDGGDIANPPIAVAGDFRYWKIRVDPKAGAMGAQAPRLSVGWNPGVVVFAARGRGPFQLAYGSARVTPAALPIDTLVPGYDRARRETAAFPLARLGAVIAEPSSRALETPIDAKRWLLWASLALGAIVLGWMALSLSRQMREAVPSQKPPSDAR